MLGSLIIASFVIYGICVIVKGFCLYSIMLFIPTAMFAVRKVDVHVKLSTIITTEALFLFASIVFTLLFGHMKLWKYIVVIILRAIFWIICYYDDSQFVYIHEERKKK